MEKEVLVPLLLNKHAGSPFQFFLLEGFLLLSPAVRGRRGGCGGAWIQRPPIRSQGVQAELIFYGLEISLLKEMLFPVF